MAKNTNIYSGNNIFKQSVKIPAGSEIVLLSNLVKYRARHKWQFADHMKRMNLAELKEVNTALEW